jgi:hypothetical protein
VAPESSTPTGLSPGTIEGVYGFTTTAASGTGQTIALVDAFNDPDAASDLNEFSAEYGLPGECTGGSSPPSCFEFNQVNETGGSSLPSSDASWGLEISLDIEWAHALAPAASILLVEASSANLGDLMAAEQYAAAHAKYVSNSWGSPEFSGEEAFDTSFTEPGVSYFAAAGDTGGVVIWPSASPDVISVGGTSLTFSSGGALAQESAWSSGGGGCSSYESASPYQSTGSVSCAGMRATPDISLDADPNSGVSVYDSSYSAQSDWWTVGGTSASTPMVAASAAVTGTQMNAQNLYSSTPDISIRDIVTGSNGYPTLPGYDLATGLGAWSDTPGAPALTAKEVAGGVTLTWKNSPSSASAGDYTIWRGTASGDETTEIATVVAPTTTYTDTSLSVGSTAYYEVQAVNDLGVSPLSNEVSGSPQGPDFTVTFAANGGTGTMAAEVDNTPAALTTDSFSRAGYSFSGWNSAANGSGTSYADGAIYPFTTSATLYAQWVANIAYTVTFSANGGTGTMAGETDNQPAPLTIDSFARVGYSFAGWNSAANGSGTSYADGAIYPFTTSATLYAQWTATAYRVLFNPNGGSGIMADETYSRPAPLSANAFTRSGYSFSTWNTTANGSGTSYADGAIYPFTADVTLYAQWTEDKAAPPPSAPTVTAVSPVAGPVSGGTLITITGTGFSTIAGDTEIEFGSAASPATSCSSTTKCTAVAPSEGAGTVNVVASTPQATSATSLADRFSYEPVPTISKLTPRNGPTSGGTKVTILGASFVGTVSVHFGNQLGRNMHLLSASEITAVAPSGSGTVLVTVSATGGSSPRSTASTFSFVPSPTIVQVTPNKGPKRGGTRVVVWGHNFVGTVSVYFGAKRSRAVQVISSHELTAIAPARPGTVYVTVITVGGPSRKTAASRFSFVAPPTITKITLATGPTRDGAKVLIRGHNFVGKVSVYLGSRKASGVRVLSPSVITVIVPPMPRAVYVTVSAAGGISKKTAATKYLYRAG